MLSILERDRAYRRRLAASLALAIVLQLLAWWLVPSPIGGPPGLLRGLGTSGGGAGLALYDVALPRAEPAAASAPAQAAAPPVVTAPEKTVLTPQAEPEITTTPTPMGPPAPSALEVAGSGTGGSAREASASGAGARSGGGSPGEGGGAPGGGPQVLHPQLWVHPEMPQRTLVQRKIDDVVLLQVLVGSDGRVHDVRTLRDIANCEECTRNAVEAAWRLTFDPPVVPEDSSGVWSQIINYRFSYRR